MQKLIIGIAPAMSVEIESEDMKEIVERAVFWNDLPPSCPICEAPVRFTFRQPKDDSFWGMECAGKTRHETTFGVYRERAGKGLFYKGNSSWKEYQFRNGNEEFSSGAEPTAELDRLDREILKEWQSASRSTTLEAALEKRFGRSLAKLTFAEKRDVLSKLQAG